MSKPLQKKEQKKEFKKKTITFSLVLKAIIVACVAVIVAFVVDSFFLENGKIRRNIYFGEYVVSDMDKENFSDFVNQYKKDVFSKKIFLSIENTEIIILPSHIGLDIDSNILWQDTYAIGRDKYIIQRFKSWLTGLLGTRNVPITSFVNEDVFDKNISQWQRDAGLAEPFEGSVVIKGVAVVSELPKNGKTIDAKALLENLIDLFVSGADQNYISAPIIEEPFHRDPELISEFAGDVKTFISKPIILANTKFEDVSLTLSVHDLVDILNVSVPKDPKIKPSLSIDDLVFAEKLLVLQVRNADFKINDDYSVQLLPGRNGVDVNLKKTKQNLEREALKRETSIVHIEVNDILAPDFSNIDATNLGIEHVVSEFTTHYSCCVSRAENIQLIADLLDGTIVRAGEELNVNAFIGERTAEKGFKPAGSIFKGEMVESVGGGISQFITTFHNALYWGGYEIIKHQPHSIYFSRYPHGIDATINWPYVDYIFKNDTESSIIIDTEYTDTSITIRILGDNKGRVLTGDHTYWNTPMKVIKEGEDSARRVVSTVADAYGFRAPVVQYKSDASLSRAKAVLKETGKKGWSTLVDRKIYVGEELYRHDMWPVYYQSGKYTVYAIHPCDNPSEKNKKNC